MAFLASLFPGVTLFAIMFALGLGLPSSLIGLAKRRPALVARVLIGTCLLVPIVAWLLLRLPLSEGIPGPARYAIALMAICPSAPLTLRKAGKAGGSFELAALLQIAAATLAIVSVPLVAELYTRSFEIQGWDIGPREVTGQIIQSQLLPLGCGLLIREWQPAWAARWQGVFNRVANGLLLLLLVLVLVRTGHLLVPFVGANALALPFMAAMVVASLSIGYLLSGGDAEERTTLALVTSMRNPGLALLLAARYAPTMEGLKIGLVIYLLVTVLLSIPFLRWSRS